MKLASPHYRTTHPPVPPDSDDCFREDQRGTWHWRRSEHDHWTPIRLAALVERDHIAHKAFARWIQTSDAAALQYQNNLAATARHAAYEWLKWSECE